MRVGIRFRGSGFRIFVVACDRHTILSLAQAPRSINLQRSEQNGRKGDSGPQITALAQRGQLTVRLFRITGHRVSLNMPGNLILARISILPTPSGYSFGYPGLACWAGAAKIVAGIRLQGLISRRTSERLRIQNWKDSPAKASAVRSARRCPFHWFDRASADPVPAPTPCRRA